MAQQEAANRRARARRGHDFEGGGDREGVHYGQIVSEERRGPRGSRATRDPIYAHLLDRRDQNAAKVIPIPDPPTAKPPINPKP